MIDQQVIWEVLGVIFAAGAMYAKLQAIQKDIGRLYDKVEAHNKFDRRILLIESKLGLIGEGKK